ncbi:MAG: AIR synthase family protein [Anaerolineales bacterium]|nr:AIR synthase family protein [Anaerolineales bacterium]
MPPLPLGKLPPELLAKIISGDIQDKRVIIGPRIGFDCAVVSAGDAYLVFKSDPITFASDEIGWYTVQVNANDIATTGATPRWFLTTCLLPEGKTTPELVETIAAQVARACEQINVTVIGGHTEITYGLDRPIIVGTMIGEVAPKKMVTPDKLNPGDTLLLTKGVPIEATAILAREFSDELAHVLTAEELKTAQDYLYKPGISVLKDAQIAVQHGRVTAMHDPTENGLAGGLWELAIASGHTLVIDPTAIPIPALSGKICAHFKLDPLATIASGALLLACHPADASSIIQGLVDQGINCVTIGTIEKGNPEVWQQTEAGRILLPRPVRDEITRAYESA